MLCAKRGLNWDAMSEQEREDFIDDIGEALEWKSLLDKNVVL